MLPVEHGPQSAWLKIFRDRTEEREAEQRQKLLLRELSHRVKNTLAMVQSFASQTLRGSGVAARARESFEARLIALANGHDVLTRENWEGADLREVVLTALGPFRTGKDRLHVEGPVVHLTPKAALALTIGLHELATNATKYGALSNATGRVASPGLPMAPMQAIFACAGRRAEVRRSPCRVARASGPGSSSAASPAI